MRCTRLSLAVIFGEKRIGKESDQNTF